MHLNPSAIHLAATKGVLTFMAWTKAQTLAACAAGLLLLGGATAVTWNVVRGTPREVVLDPAAQSARTSTLPARADRGALVPVPRGGDRPATLPSDWRSQFEAAYGLGPDQVIRHVAPPFAAVRQAFYDDEQRKQGATRFPPLFQEESLLITWDGGTPHWTAATLDGGTLDDALWFCAELRPWDLDKSVPRTLKLRGDFAVGKGATAEEVMRGLGPIVSAELRRPIHFERRRVPREAVVVRGSYRYTPLEGESEDGVINFAPHYPAKVAVKQGSLGQMLNQIKNQLEVRVFDETGASSLPVRWRYDERWVNPARLLADVARQTSLTFTREPRDADVWFMVEGARGNAE
jgi:hypothetical protein